MCRRSAEALWRTGTWFPVRSPWHDAPRVDANEPSYRGALPFASTCPRDAWMKRPAPTQCAVSAGLFVFRPRLPRAMGIMALRIAERGRL